MDCETNHTRTSHVHLTVFYMTKCDFSCTVNGGCSLHDTCICFPGSFHDSGYQALSYQWKYPGLTPKQKFFRVSGIGLGMHPAIERRYIVTMPLIGWVWYASPWMNDVMCHNQAGFEVMLMLATLGRCGFNSGVLQHAYWDTMSSTSLQTATSFNKTSKWKLDLERILRLLPPHIIVWTEKENKKTQVYFIG